MPDPYSSTGPQSNQPPLGNTQKTTSNPPDFKEATQGDDDGKEYTVMNMKMSKKQYDMFMKNLSNTVIDQIKQDEANYNQTQEQIRLDEQLDEGGS